MKVFLDDIREPEWIYNQKNCFDNDLGGGWIKSETVDDTIELLKTGEVEVLSLDHDLGCTDKKHVGADVMKWLEEQVFCNNLTKIPRILFHTSNPVGKQNMVVILEHIQKYLESKT